MQGNRELFEKRLTALFPKVLRVCYLILTNHVFEAYLLVTEGFRWHVARRQFRRQVQQPSTNERLSNLASKDFEKKSDHATQLRKASKREAVIPTQLRKASKRGAIIEPSFERLRKEKRLYQPSFERLRKQSPPAQRSFERFRKQPLLHQHLETEENEEEKE